MDTDTPQSEKNLMILNEYHRKLGSHKTYFFFKSTAKVSKEQCIEEAAKMTKWLYNEKVKLELIK